MSIDLIAYLSGAFFGSFFSLLLSIYTLFRLYYVLKTEKFDKNLSLIKLLLIFFINLSLMMCGLYTDESSNIILFGVFFDYIIVIINVIAMSISLLCLILGTIKLKI
ncbi:MAG: hypothetical protein LBR15_01180 [Methanobrevibacter sp.]|nr:hypothetical protein [Candidatus Methanovirga australis]